MSTNIFSYKVEIRVTDGEENPLKEERLSSETDIICPHYLDAVGALFCPPCKEKAVVRYSLGKYSSVACDGDGGGDVYHSTMAKQEVVQAFWEEMLKLHGHNPK